MEKEPAALTISDDDIARIREGMRVLGSEIRDFKSALNAYQTKIRRTMVRLGDVGKRGDGEEVALTQPA